MAWVTCAYVARRRDQGGPRPLSCIVSKQLQAGCTGGPSACASPPFWYAQSIAGGGGAPPRHRSVGSNGRGGHGRPAPRPAQPAPGGAQPTPSRATGLQGHPRPTRFNPSWGCASCFLHLGRPQSDEALPGPQRESSQKLLLCLKIPKPPTETSLKLFLWLQIRVDSRGSLPKAVTLRRFLANFTMGT